MPAPPRRWPIGKNLANLDIWKCLWLQDAAKRGGIVVRRVDGKRNPADILTKPLAFNEMVEKLALVRVVAGP